MLISSIAYSANNVAGSKFNLYENFCYSPLALIFRILPKNDSTGLFRAAFTSAYGTLGVKLLILQEPTSVHPSANRYRYTIIVAKLYSNITAQSIKILKGYYQRYDNRHELYKLEETHHGQLRPMPSRLRKKPHRAIE